MKIVIAPDSFKGCLSSPEVSSALERGIKKILPDCCILSLPAADGGEGTLRALVSENHIRSIPATGPVWKRVASEYGVKDGLGIVETAQAAGLTLAEPPLRGGLATSFGAGELVLECLKSGCKRILLTLGGSATNDGGCGLFCALGARFLRKNGEAFVPTGLTLEEIDSIDISGVAGAFFSCFFTVAADVKNTLLGEAGATYTYAPQKGALPGDLEKMERGMEHYASLLFRESGVRVAELPSSGAAGGMAAPVMAFGRCDVRSGAEAVLSAKGFYSEAKDADLVLTGEGSLDGQSLYGKTAGAAADFCRKENIPIYAVCGAFKDSEGLREHFAKILTVEALAENRDDSVKNASRYLEALGALAAIDVMSGAVKTEGRDAQ